MAEETHWQAPYAFGGLRSGSYLGFPHRNLLGVDQLAYFFGAPCVFRAPADIGSCHHCSR
jgi:hypothetical protein